MKKLPLGGLAAAGMLLWAPPASAGYWTGHSNLIRDLIENWIIDQLEAAGYSPSAREQNPSLEEQVLPQEKDIRSRADEQTPKDGR